MPRRRKSSKPPVEENAPALPVLPSPPPSEQASAYFNRELSWLEFNFRVLAEAEDESVPLLDRVKFVAIFGGNLDEFFMKRVGGLKLQLASRAPQISPDGRTPLEQLRAIQARVRPMIAQQRRIFLERLLPALKPHGIELLGYRDLSEEEREYVRRYFEANIFPILTPLGLDHSHPFPFISNLSISLAVALRRPGSGEIRFARVKVPPTLPRWVQLPESLRFIPIEAVITENLDRLLPGMEVVESYPFRVTRAADVQRFEEPAEDLLESVQEELRERRFAAVVRLEVVPEMPAWMRSLLLDELGVGPEDLYEARPPLAFRDLFSLAGLPLPTIREAPWRPVTHPRLAPGPDGKDPDLFRVIARGDLLVHHPYDSFATSVQRFLEVSAQDPQVLAIKQTLYRTSRNSPVVKSLIEAAERGKQVAVLVELKASFDEARNIEWAEALEGAGAHVAYGVVGFKTHAKVSLVVRQEPDGLRTYTHLATGNYNTDTAELYTDLGLFTCSPEIGADALQLFNLLTAGQLAGQEFRSLLVAPVNMRAGILGRIAREVEHQRAGRGGRIVAKMNSLEDPKIVDALYEASAAGVEMDFIVRGVCRLRPGLPGKSERIRVLSIIGRFLEHARIFKFANGGAPEYWLGSCDWMSRNIDWRVEAMVPVLDSALQAELQAILDVQLADNCRAWDLGPDGTYVQRSPAPGEERRASQQILMERALRRTPR
ncbi:MAG: polyphosphate kinase 1 [Thermoanaerobaculia bacterium]